MGTEVTSFVSGETLGKNGSCIGVAVTKRKHCIDNRDDDAPSDRDDDDVDSHVGVGVGGGDSLDID